MSDRLAGKACLLPEAPVLAATAQLFAAEGAKAIMAAQWKGSALVLAPR